MQFVCHFGSAVPTFYAGNYDNDEQQIRKDKEICILSKAKFCKLINFFFLINLLFNQNLIAIN